MTRRSEPYTLADWIEDDCEDQAFTPILTHCLNWPCCAKNARIIVEEKYAKKWRVCESCHCSYGEVEVQP